MRKSILILLLATLCGMQAMAYDFSVGGINYTKIPCGEYICTSYQVTVAPGSYSGDVVIPAMVRYDGVDYEVLRIGAGAFEGCTGLTSVYVEEGYLAMVVYDAFRGCTHLRKVDLSSTLRVLDMDIFDGCSSLDSIIIRSVVPPTSTYDELTFAGVNPDVVIVVPCGALLQYLSTDLFSGMTVVDDCNSPLSVDDADGGVPPTLAVYPNPATHHTTVAADGEVLLYDLRGCPLRRQQAADGRAVISLDGLVPGVYLLRSGNRIAKVVVTME